MVSLFGYLVSILSFIYTGIHKTGNHISDFKWPVQQYKHLISTFYAGVQRISDNIIFPFSRPTFWILEQKYVLVSPEGGSAGTFARLRVWYITGRPHTLWKQKKVILSVIVIPHMLAFHFRTIYPFSPGNKSSGLLRATHIKYS